jgi:hypothetical protein
MEELTMDGKTIHPQMTQMNTDEKNWKRKRHLRLSICVICGWIVFLSISS